MIREGRGFVIQAAEDTPWAAWFSLRKLDWSDQLKTCPALFYRQLGEMMAVSPGGASIVWDAQEPYCPGGSGCLSAIEDALANLPGLSLHIKTPLASVQIEAPLNVWFHSPEMPSGSLATSWCRGLVGWIPQPRPGWSLPGFGYVPPDEEQDYIGCMTWGEVAVPVPAISNLEIDALVLAMEDVQAHIEKAMSLRANAGAWPQSIPFQRRQTSWRLALTGGWEFQVSGGSWDTMAEKITELKKILSQKLKCRIQIGVNSDALIAGILARQALKFGHPWRSTLGLHAVASFTPGIAADARKKSPLDARVFLPAALAELLSDPPVASLRVPAIPSAESVGNFLRGLEALPAIRWLPPGMPPFGPFHHDIPWDPAEAFPPVWDGKAKQKKLFELDD
ncbi:MAG: hypothetical protein LBC63_04015 [Holophagales bacterium]|jgi:hypothetical protein|nr:hypothetical protein [Holophagales bacterium]